MRGLGGEPLRCHLPLQERVSATDHTDHPVLGQCLHVHLGRHRVDHPQFQVGGSLPQERHVHMALRQKADTDAGRLPGGAREEGRAEGRGDHVLAEDREGALHRPEVGVPAGPEQRTGPLHHRAHLGAHGERVRCRHHATAGPDEDRITEGLADPAEGAAHRRLGQVQPAGGALHALLLQQNVQREQQVQVQARGLRHAQVSLAKVALESKSGASLR